MRRQLLFAIAAMLLVAGVAVAATGDFTTVSGTVLNLNNDLLVLRADNGATYYIDARRASSSRQFRPGDVVTVAGYEGSRKDEIQASVIDVAVGSAGLAQGNLNLPRDHRYEQYVEGNYSVVPVDRVPELVQKGTMVYDRTAKAWVYHTNTGINPQYLAMTPPGGNLGQPISRYDQLQGTVERVSGSHITVRTDDNRTVDVDMSQARVRTEDSIQRGDRVTVIGTDQGNNRFMARGIRDERRAQGDTAFTRIHGRVQDIKGSTMHFKTDDGRTLTVDMTKVASNSQAALDPGEGATIIGFPGVNNAHFRAEYVRQDSADVAGGTLPARGQEVTLEGQASSFEGRSVRFTTNTGMHVMVDTSKVNDDQHRLLVSSAPVRVVGVRGQGDTIVARQITRDDASARASKGSMADESKATTVRGKVVSVSGDTLKMRTDDGRNLTLDITAVRDGVVRQLKPGDAFSAVGFYRGDDRSQFSVRSLKEDTAPSASPSTLPAKGKTVTLEGQAGSFEARSVRFTSKDGLRVMIDTSKVNDEQHRLLVSAAPVKVVGVRGDGDTIIAQRITREDSSARRPVGSVADEQGAITVRGKVVSLSGDTLKARTNDGRNVTLDITAVRDGVVKKLKPGDSFSAVGFYRGDDRSQFSVRSLKEDVPAASPKTK